MSGSEKTGELLAGIADSSATLTDAEGLALQVADQNARYDEAREIFKDDKEILDIVLFGIAEEQEETYANILSMAPESGRIYESIGSISLKIDKNRDAAKARMAFLSGSVTAQEAAMKEKIEEKKQEELLKYTELLARIEHLAPRAVEPVKALLETRVTEPFDDPDISEIERTILELMDQEYEAEEDLKRVEKHTKNLETIVGQLAVSWEMPLALMDQNRLLTVVLDELPVEPVIAECSSNERKQFAQRHVDQPQAAILSAGFLSEHQGQTITVDQIAQILYSPEVMSKVSEQNLRSRVTTILGPKVGENLRSILEKEGYILQYGWRRTLEQKPDNSIKVKKLHRIYRAINKNNVSDYIDNNSYEGDGYTDNFAPLRISNDVTTNTTTLREEFHRAVEISEQPERERGESEFETSETTHDLIQEDRTETNSQRKERLKNELITIISGPTKSAIKTISQHKALEEGGIKLGHLKNVYMFTEITDDDVRHVISSRVTPNSDYWLKTTDAIRLILSVTLDDENVRTNVGSKRWRRVVNEKIEELIHRELRGIEYRKNAKKNRSA